MAVYAVGDIQGCYQALRRVLEKVNFNPAQDVLWCCGDVVNRGPDSLAVLRYLRGLGDACVCVLGNHDLHLLAYAAGGRSYPKDTLEAVLEAKDAEDLLDWLRHRPLLHVDTTLNKGLVHAGLSPLWTWQEAQTRAASVEQVLQSGDWGAFCKSLQTNKFPRQDEAAHHANDGKNEGEVRVENHAQNEQAQLRFSAVVLTRTRYCQQDGVFDWQNKSSAMLEDGVLPWFEHEKLAWRAGLGAAGRLVYGHWAAKGLMTQQAHVLGLDSGYVWGGSLTLARLDTEKLTWVAVDYA
ncbi:MAG: symmetrical bis(5'-nucleosyl)-tetraphosphatase [Mariprofundaceae bacterium]|nr:symmetrical bis(5'-nucleosyl)-tetraphosphatase [Mariprofundaceae bacterium]